MDKVNRKITVEEEADLYEKEALSEIKKQRFNGTEEMGKPYSTLQMGRRVVYRAKQELASRVEVVRCKDCKHRGSETYCPMCFEEWYEIDEGDGYYDSDFTTHDRTIDEGFCDRGERKENEETNEERNAVG